MKPKKLALIVNECDEVVDLAIKVLSPVFDHVAVDDAFAAWEVFRRHRPAVLVTDRNVWVLSRPLHSSQEENERLEELKSRLGGRAV